MPPVRPISKICQLLVEEKANTLTNLQKELLIETLFDWMISDHKVAVKVYTMQTLFSLGKEFNWIHNELQLIIKNNINTESVAYKARGRMTLQQIQKYKKD